MENKIEFRTQTNQIQDSWVMRITSDRRIEVNEDVEVTEAAHKVLEALQHMLTPQRKPLTPDMFWNQDDAETPYDSIEEFLNDEICNGYLEMGAEFTLLQAKRFPSVKIKVTSIDWNECEAEYEIIEAAHGIKE